MKIEMPDNVEPQADLSILIRRLVWGRPEQAFKAWTEPEQLIKWWGPSHVKCPQCEIDLQVGGKYRIANLLPDGSTIWIIGQFLRIERPGLLSYSWLSGADPQFETDAKERVTVRFIDKGQKTEIIIEHNHIGDQTTHANHTMGWNGCLDGIEEYCKK